MKRKEWTADRKVSHMQRSLLGQSIFPWSQCFCQYWMGCVCSPTLLRMLHKIELQSEHTNSRCTFLSPIFERVASGKKHMSLTLPTELMIHSLFSAPWIPWPTISKLESSPRLHGSSTLTARPASSRTGLLCSLCFLQDWVASVLIW